MQFIDASVRQFQAGAALGQYIRVKLSSGKLAAAGVTDVELGVMREASFADLDYRGVILRTKQGTTPMVCAGAVTAGAAVYTAANGKIDDATPTGAVRIGVALEAGSGDGSVIEVLRD